MYLNATEDDDPIGIIIICGAAVIVTLLMIICITAAVIMVPCRKRKKSRKKLSKHDGVEQPDDDRPQQCTSTSNASKHTKMKLHVHIPASPNTSHNGKKSAQAKKKPVHTGKKSVQTDSDSTQHGELGGCTASGGALHTYDIDEVADPTDNIIGLILTHPNHCHCHRMGKMLT